MGSMGQTVYFNPHEWLIFYDNFQWLGGFNQIFDVHPDPLGEMMKFDDHIFLGWVGSTTT